MPTRSRGSSGSDFLLEDEVVSDKRFRDDDPEDLPDLPSVSVEKRTSAVRRAHTCPYCGGEVRLVSNCHGVRAYCGPCKKDWSVAMQAFRPNLPLSGERGLSKVTVMEPDWDRAFEDLDNDDRYRKGGY